MYCIVPIIDFNCQADDLLFLCGEPFTWGGGIVEKIKLAYDGRRAPVMLLAVKSLI